MAEDLLSQIQRADLRGRGGASFPVHLKWQRFAQVDKPEKLIVCNASEGEPGISKDFYILERHTEQVFKGMLLAMAYFQTKRGYFYINRNYYHKLQSKIDPFLALYQQEGFDLRLFIETPSYIGGETGALLNHIEGKAVQPRPPQPSPSLVGIHGVPVLLHNVETFYDIALVAASQYQGKRFYTLSGVKKPGVYSLPIDLSVEQLLQQTDNQPDFPYIALVGGGASGTVVRQDQATEVVVAESGGLEIYPATTDIRDLLKKWCAFNKQESCGYCVPCFKGSHDLWTLVEKLTPQQAVPWEEILKITRIMRLGSFCALGRTVIKPIESYAVNILALKLK